MRLALRGNFWALGATSDARKLMLLSANSPCRYLSPSDSAGTAGARYDDFRLTGMPVGRGHGSLTAKPSFLLPIEMEGLKYSSRT